MKKLLNYFLQGLLFVVPVTVTFYVLLKTILWVDSLLPFQIPMKIPGFPQLEIPGLGLLTIFIFIAAVGYIGGKYIRNPLFSYIDQLVERAPLVKLIYGSVKDLVEAFVGEKRRFNRPVLVSLGHNAELNRIGFVTQEDLTELGLEKNLVAVYFPFSYSFAGELIVVPREKVKPIDASGTDMMKFIISGGVTEIKD
ncbi:MAG: DUF502 domain-containing protein [Bacteroidetes bacterium]|nr:MAG: DUF502 domain-containing protein [Bacteroidota bacterium]REK04813.1 MAG: DUF502 domain-containing protein [Bacteroidota bacterium]REK36286.1 MAG: DUF502 domain-containing protein [Bacteroidota bacterium]REK51050.1 MAG: DUF502 domain-containing protein [Bacteroidota bacterium]